LIPLELAKSKIKVIRQISNTKILFGNDREFNFDEIYSEDSNQERIFNVSVKPILDKALSGYNCCLFAYGQTVKFFNCRVQVKLTQWGLTSIKTIYLYPVLVFFLYRLITCSTYLKLYFINT
jgi:hypothetical protein